MKKKANKFPNISRFFTENLKKNLLKNKQKNTLLKRLFLSILIIVLFLFIVFMVIDLRQKTFIAQDLDYKHEEILKDIKEWEKVVNKYPDYKDGYLQLAILELKRKNFNMSKLYLEKVFNLDPNSKEGRQLESYLNKY